MLPGVWAHSCWMTPPLGQAASLQSIARVDNYEIFQSWSPSPGADFKRVNVIYGPNGSGKSTLARLFQDCRDRNAVGSGLSAKVGDPARIITEDAFEFWSDVRVFNRRYVTENLRFDAAGGPCPDSLLTIGEENVEREVELAEAVESRARTDAEVEYLRSSLTSLKSERDALMTGTARSVRVLLSGVYGFNATQSYHKGHVENQLSERASATQSQDVSADVAVARSPLPGIIALIAPPQLAGRHEFDKANELLARRVLTQTLDDLAQSPRAGAWVQQGLALHEGNDRCLFCTHELLPPRRQALEAHFNDALTTLQHEANQLIERLELSKSAATAYAVNVPDPTRFHPALGAQADQTRHELGSAVERYTRELDELVAALREKSNNPFRVEDALGIDELATPTPDGVEELIREHGRLRNEHAAIQDAAAQRVAWSCVLEITDEYDDLLGQINSCETDLAKADEKFKQIEKRIDELKNVDGDPAPLADELTRNLHELLGRAELRILPDRDSARYRIERDGRPAENLSEGEQNAIALLYFLASLRGQGAKQSVVVVDDPASSLDQDMLFGVSAHLWSQLVIQPGVARQVIVLTHNFEFFRQWSIQLHSTYKQNEYRLFALHAFSVGAVRAPVLEPWPFAKKFQSQYHYLFQHVAEEVERSQDPRIGTQLEHRALIPNTARRLLENFLSFRYPVHIANFRDGLKAAFKTAPELNNPATRHRMERLLHAGSHQDGQDFTAPINGWETTSVLHALFALINAVDAKHFEDMCTHLALDPAKLLPPTRPGR